MKKTLYISFLLLAISSGMAKGQAALLVLIFGDKVATENFYFSLKLGLNYSIIHGYEDGKNGLGLNFGLVNNIRLTDKLSLTPEFLPLSPRSIKDVTPISTGDPDLDELLKDAESSDRKLSYIDIPILLKVKLSDRFRISAGPQISILTAASDVYKTHLSDDVTVGSEINIKSSISSVDAGAVIDLEYVAAPPKNGKGVNIFIRYSKGFVGLVKEGNGNHYTTSLIQVGATFPFVEKKP